MQVVVFPKRNKYQKILLILLPVVVIGLAYLLYGRVSSGQLLGPNLFTGITSGGETSPKAPNILNGVLVDLTLANRRPLAIMVENHTAARPQVGLTKAAIIFEAIAEGGITRFLAVYGPFDAQKVGPVRSARQYYVEWAKSMDALYAHVGGSADALSLIKTLNVPDLDQFRYGTRAYRREPQPGLAIEHTMFTSTQKLYDLAKSIKLPLTASLTPYLFKADAKQEERGTSQRISIPFSNHAYRVEWTYEPATNTYLRSHGGVEHTDRLSGERISAKNVIAATVKRSLKEDANGFTMTTTGSGKATVFLDGKRVAGTWKRPSRTDMIRFYDESGQEVELNRGQIWIEIVPPEVVITAQ